MFRIISQLARVYLPILRSFHSRLFPWILSYSRLFPWILSSYSLFQTQILPSNPFLLKSFLQILSSNSNPFSLKSFLLQILSHSNFKSFLTQKLFFKSPEHFRYDRFQPRKSSNYARVLKYFFFGEPVIWLIPSLSLVEYILYVVHQPYYIFNVRELMESKLQSGQLIYYWGTQIGGLSEQLLYIRRPFCMST